MLKFRKEETQFLVSISLLYFKPKIIPNGKFIFGLYFNHSKIIGFESVILMFTWEQVMCQAALKWRISHYWVKVMKQEKRKQMFSWKTSEKRFTKYFF